MKNVEIINKRTSSPIQLEIYDGFENLDRMNSYLKRYTTLNKYSFAIIIFYGQFYAVAVDGTDRAIVVGKEAVWYYKNHILNQTTWRYFKEPYKMYPLTKIKSYKNQVSLDLKELDPSLQIVAWREGGFRELTSHFHSDTYLNLLGRTFYCTFFNFESYREELIPYFDTSTFRGYFKTGIAGINPFQNRVLMKNGNKTRERFY